MEAKATLKMYRQSPRKVRLLAGGLTGHSIERAKSKLDSAPKRVAPVLLKLLRSAEANAREKNMDMESLRITKLSVDEGPTMFRMRPRAHGRAFVIRKRTSHITVVLAPGKEERANEEENVEKKAKTRSSEVKTSSASKEKGEKREKKEKAPEKKKAVRS